MHALAIATSFPPMLHEQQPGLVLTQSLSTAQPHAGGSLHSQISQPSSSVLNPNSQNRSHATGAHSTPSTQVPPPQSAEQITSPVSGSQPHTDGTQPTFVSHFCPSGHPLSTHPGCSKSSHTPPPPLLLPVLLVSPPELVLPGSAVVLPVDVVPVDVVPVVPSCVVAELDPSVNPPLPPLSVSAPVLVVDVVVVWLVSVVDAAVLSPLVPVFPPGSPHPSPITSVAHVATCDINF